MTNKVNRFVIYEPTVLVALDLEGCLRDHDPDAEIVWVPSLAEALRFVVDGSASLALLNTGADRVPAATVPILLIGDAAEEHPGAWPVLRRPFSADDVAAALVRLDVRRGHARV
jgi:hypothetical protein